MRLAIRDDDACYFTQPEQLDRIYSRFAGLPVSLAVTPFALKSENLGDPDRFYQVGPPAALSENADLMLYLREHVARERFSVLCHGYTHEYERRGADLIQECLWKSPARLSAETAEGKAYLEKVLDCGVDIYVPPGNAISREGIAAVGEALPNILATLPLRRYREFLFDAVARESWAQRLIHQARFRGPAPFPYQMGRTRLLACSSWTAITDWAQICARMDLCERLGADFTIAVHYWELEGRVLDGLHRLVDRALGKGFQPAHCRQLFANVEAAVVAPGKAQEERAWADSKIS